MPRPLTTALAAEMAAARFRPAFFFQAHFLSGDIFLWTGYGQVNWNGQVWTGVGTLGGITPIQESSDVQATNVTFTLSGIPSDLIGKAINETRQGYAVQLWFGALGDNGNVVADPLRCFAGRMDVPVIEEGEMTSTISITVESRLVDLKRSRERRYTDQDQQIDFPGDLGFQYLSSLQDWNGVWGKASGAGGAGVGRGRGAVPPRGGGSKFGGLLQS